VTLHHCHYFPFHLYLSFKISYRLSLLIIQKNEWELVIWLLPLGNCLILHLISSCILRKHTHLTLISLLVVTTKNAYASSVYSMREIDVQMWEKKKNEKRKIEKWFNQNNIICTHVRKDFYREENKFQTWYDRHKSNVRYDKWKKPYINIYLRCSHCRNLLFFPVYKWNKYFKTLPMLFFFYFAIK